MLRAHTTPADRRLPSIRSIPALAAHLPPLLLSPTTSPASSYRTVTPTDDGSSSADDKTEALGVMAAEAKGEEVQVMCKPKVSSRLGRKLPNKACGPCKKLHTECDAERPCKTCIRRGREHLCVDVPSKRGQKARQRNAALATAAPPPSRPTLTRSPPLLDLPPLPPLPTPPAAFFKSPPVARPPLLRISSRFEPYPTSRPAHPLPPPSSGLSYSDSSPLPVVFASSYFQPPPPPFPARRFSLIPVPPSTAASIASSSSSSISVTAVSPPYRAGFKLLQRHSSGPQALGGRSTVAGCSGPQSRPPMLARESSGQVV
ncbi:hypothetical protein JCM10207_002734 [Rhodosporidiobolus poonsookiae]